jgi:hypothetical protein
MNGIAAVAAWTSPALVVAVVARVTSGGVEAPLLVLAVVAAPLLALLAGPGSPPVTSGFAVTVGVVTATCVLAAGFRALTDLGHVLGLETGATVGSAAALVLAATVWPDHHRVAATATLLGALALVSALAMLATAVGAPPWTAWSQVASRSAFTLGPRSEWTGDGARFPAPVTLTFGDPHRVTAVTPAVVRVTEADRRTTTHERHLAAGEALSVRPGDTVVLPAGARFRFEPGRRVPGAPESGVRWADGADASPSVVLVRWLGLTVTLVGGALMTVRAAPSTSAVAGALGPAVALGVVVAAACWGVYAVDRAPELAIGAPAAALLVRLPPIVADEPWRSRLLAAVVLAQLALFVGCAGALRHVFVELRGANAGAAGGPAPGRRRVLDAAGWIAVVAAAAALGAVATDAFTPFVLGSGLAAAILIGPLVATRRAADGRARAAGALAGGAVFAAVAALGWWSDAARALGGLARHPVLVAVPAAWLVSVVCRAAGGRRA